MRARKERDQTRLLSKACDRTQWETPVLFKCFSTFRMIKQHPSIKALLCAKRCARSWGIREGCLSFCPQRCTLMLKRGVDKGKGWSKAAERCWQDGKGMGNPRGPFSYPACLQHTSLIHRGTVSLSKVRCSCWTFPSVVLQAAMDQWLWSCPRTPRRHSCRQSAVGRRRTCPQESASDDSPKASLPTSSEQSQKGENEGALPLATTRMGLEGLMLGEISQTGTSAVWSHLQVECIKARLMKT